MKPHPRIRKTIKYGGAALTVLLLVLWIGSGWGRVALFSQSGKFVAAASGRLMLGDVRAQPFPALAGLRITGPYRYEMKWGFEFEAVGTAWQWWMPLWVPAGLAFLPTALAFRLDTLARRRALLNHCQTCHYDRTGLAPTSPCPECGTAIRLDP